MICEASAPWPNGEALAQSSPDSQSSQTRPTRGRPQLQPPPNSLQFSANPTAQELFRVRIFEEPLVPVGGQPSVAENAALAAALEGYGRRAGPDDFSSLTGYLQSHPNSAWAPALLTDLGLEYYHTAHYSLALDAWTKAWARTKSATDPYGKAFGDRAAGELACMYARLGRTTELEALLKAVEGRVFVGPATARITDAREGLWTMQHRPEISFRCGPLALQKILRSDQRLLAASPTNGFMQLLNAPSTPKGCSLAQVAELSKKAALDFQMAFRGPAGDFVVPAVVHWKLGHYAAMVRQDGDKYLIEDVTFGNTVWATRKALEEESSGYFLIPAGRLPKGWRGVDVSEGETIWGKGAPQTSDGKPLGPCDPNTGGSSPCDSSCPVGGGGGGRDPGSGLPNGRRNHKPFMVGGGMTVSSVHLSTVNLNLRDSPVGYSPPVGPPVEFTVRYNHRDAFQPTIFSYSNFGPKWTCDWISYITDVPTNTLADVNFYIRGGGDRLFTGFDTNSQTWAFQQIDQTQLRRTGPASYEMLWPDGSKLVFSQSDGSIGTTRKIFLTQVVDPYGNAVILSYDDNLRLVAITDAIGQITTLSYGATNDIYKITQVTDPFGRFASFSYDSLGRLTNITDVIGINSQFSYLTNGDFINSLTTPYGTTTFNSADSGNTRVLETIYPDGSRDRVEYNQTRGLIPDTEPPLAVPLGMLTLNGNLHERNTFYWSRNACVLGYLDCSKATVYHWLLDSDSAVGCSGILESIKEPLENRVWYDYDGQPGPGVTGVSNLPRHVGRVLDDGSTQLYTYGYNGLGNLTNTIDPIGRSFSYTYGNNGIDLLEVRQTRLPNNELLFRATYNAQHSPLTTIDAAGQTNSFTYNVRGQILSVTNPKNATTTHTYDTNGYLLAVRGPLADTNDVATATYDAYGRVQTETDVSGYTLTFAYDALDRVTTITHPDSTFEQITYERLDPAIIQDRAGRQTLLAHDAMRQLSQRTDPLGRVTRFEWCSCGAIKSLTDPLGRTTTWQRDVQSRLVTKQYGDGSQVTYKYENTTSRLRQVVDEKKQTVEYAYNKDNTLRSIAYANCIIPTPGVSYSYDPNYNRLTSMTDGTGTTLYQYLPVASPPVLGAGRLATVTGPWPNQMIAYSYDPLGRRVVTTIGGEADLLTFDAAGRIVSETNALGSFVYTYDGSSRRIVSETLPNGQTTSRAFSDKFHDFALEAITNQVGPIMLSSFIYGRDIPAGRITTWAQGSGTATPDVYSFGYDNANQLLSAMVTNSGVQVGSFAYAYDLAANRLSEQVGNSSTAASYNALNQLNTSSTSAGSGRTNEWDGQNRLTAVTTGSQRTEFTYDGLDRVASIRLLTNGVQASFRRFFWRDQNLCLEQDASGAVTKQFFNRGVQIVSGTNAGSYYYTRDHLDSIRELTDGSGNVRARYAYDPFGRRTQTGGDLSTDFGFAGMFWSSEAGLDLARFRAYDPAVGRWLSRDPLNAAELAQGPNLYAYAGNDVINATDPLGLCCERELKLLQDVNALIFDLCQAYQVEANRNCALIAILPHKKWGYTCAQTQQTAGKLCEQAVSEHQDTLWSLTLDYLLCLLTQCHTPAKCEPSPPPQPTPGDDCNLPGGGCLEGTGRHAERSAADTPESVGP